MRVRFQLGGAGRARHRAILVLSALPPAHRHGRRIDHLGRKAKQTAQESRNAFTKTAKAGAVVFDFRAPPPAPPATCPPRASRQAPPSPCPHRGRLSHLGVLDRRRHTRTHTHTHNRTTAPPAGDTVTRSKFGKLTSSCCRPGSRPAMFRHTRRCFHFGTHTLR